VFDSLVREHRSHWRFFPRVLNALFRFGPKFYFGRNLSIFILHYIDPYIYMNKWFSRPFNGQVSRHKQIQQISNVVKPDVAVETGTFLGTSTPYLATMVSGNTYTIEFVAKYAKKARMRFESEFQNLRITLIEGNSVKEIQRLLRTIPPTSTILAYLDAHWEKELPTAQELNELLQWGDNWVAVIDDFKIPGDDSYGFDQYGDLVVDQSLIPQGVRLMVPNQSAKSESGARKGTGYVFGPAYKNENLTEDFPDLREVSSSDLSTTPSI
jgi:hypothetical protein